MIFIGAMPYFMSNHGYSFVDCIFESASGWTTTGSTVIKTPLTQSLLLWKTVTGWLGGMIVIIFTTALLPYLGIGAQKLAITEIPGPDLEKMAPKFGDIAKITGGIGAHDPCRARDPRHRAPDGGAAGRHPARGAGARTTQIGRASCRERV